MNKTELAKEFAKLAHSEQKRKYTGAPYFTHLENVAMLVASVEFNEDIIAAAYLHDVVEDIGFEKINQAGIDLGIDDELAFPKVGNRETRLLLIEHYFGASIASLVEQVTDVSRPEDGNRKTRKRLDLEHLAGASPEGQTIKLADLIDNARDIQVNDPNFAVVYMREKKELLKVLTKGNKGLYNQAVEIVEGYYSGQRSSN